MTKRLPSDAFDFYVSLGEGRSYQAVADHYGCDKRTVSRTAKRDGWQKRLMKIEDSARKKSDAKLGETMAEIRERHLKTLRAMNGRALEALRTYPLSSAMVRAVGNGLE